MKRVALWIAPYVKWARSHGWNGQVTSGYRDPRKEQMTEEHGYHEYTEAEIRKGLDDSKSSGTGRLQLFVALNETAWTPDGIVKGPAALQYLTTDDGITVRTLPH